MHRGCAGAFARVPRDWSAESPIHFEHAWTVAIFFELAAIACRQTIARDRQDLARREVEKSDRRFHFVQVLNARVGHNASAKRFEIGCERVADALRASFRNRPADGVRGGAKHPSERGGSPKFRGQDGVRGDPGEESSGMRFPERDARREQSGPERQRAESRKEQWMRREMQRRDDVLRQIRPAIHHRPHEPLITGADCGLFDGALQRDGAAIIERMAERSRGMDPFEAVFRERKRLERRRADRHGMRGRADVVQKSGQRERGGARSASNGGLRLKHCNPQAGASQNNRRGQSVGPGADDERVLHLKLNIDAAAHVRRRDFVEGNVQEFRDLRGHGAFYFYCSFLKFIIVCTV